MRTFVAVNLTSPVRALATELMNNLRKQPWGKEIRWVKPENLHITLRFIGEISEDHLSCLYQHIEKSLSEVSPFTIQVNTLDLFPNQSHPQVIALLLEPHEPLEILAQHIETAVTASGFEAEKRKFSAHITLGRLRKPTAITLDNTNFTRIESLRISHVSFIKSELTESGPKYTELKRFALGCVSEEN